LQPRLANLARAAAPPLPGLLIATSGEGVCFLVNAASFAGAVVALSTMDTSALRPSRPAERARGQLREGLRYVRRDPELALPLLMMALTGMLTYEFQVSLPVLARALHGSSGTYGLMMSAMGAGAVAGGLVT